MNKNMKNLCKQLELFEAEHGLDDMEYLLAKSLAACVKRNKGSISSIIHVKEPHFVTASITLNIQ